MSQASIRIPKRSISALADGLDASELTHDWQVETLGETIIARKGEAVIVVSLQWTEQMECLGVDVRLINKGSISIVPIRFSDIFPAYPSIRWDGKEGRWKGYDERAPGFDPLPIPIRGALIAHLVREIALTQIMITHGLKPESEQAQKYAQAAMVIVGLLCGDDIRRYRK